MIGFKYIAGLIPCLICLMILPNEVPGDCSYGSPTYFGFLGYRPEVAWDKFRGDNDYIDETEFNAMLKVMFGDFFDSRPAYRIFLLNLSDRNYCQRVEKGYFEEFYEAVIEFYAATIENEYGERDVSELEYLQKNPCASLAKTKIDFAEYYLIKKRRRPMSGNFDQEIFKKLSARLPDDWPKC